MRNKRRKGRPGRAKSRLKRPINRRRIGRIHRNGSPKKEQSPRPTLKIHAPAGRSEAQRKAETRFIARDQIIPPPEDLKRRRALEKSDCDWLRFYLPTVFYHPFTDDQRSLIADAAETIRYGTSKCRAMKRGGGKSSILRYLVLKYALARSSLFSLLICATAEKGDAALAAVKAQLRCGIKAPLSRDYPLECYLARYIGSWPSKANNVTINGGHPVRMEWRADRIILPTVIDERNEIGPIIMALGVTSDALQGCNVYDTRPDWVMLDDLDSRDSLASEDGVVAQKYEIIIDQNIAGLGGPGKRLGQFMACTVPSRKSLAFRYSDPEQKPAFSGRRIPAIKVWPDAMGDWETYQELRQHGQKTLGPDGAAVDPFGREAHRFYESRKVEMDAGAVLSDPFDLDRDVLPDGTPRHLSALQKCFDYIADKGMASFATEFQQDPPEETAAIESGISDHRIMRQLSGYPAKMIPPECVLLTQGIDVQKSGVFFVVKAWRADATNYVIDYGFQETQGTIYNSDEGIEFAIRRAILTRFEEITAAPYLTADGKAAEIALTLIDSGYQAPAVYSACAQIGLGVMPAKGHGKSHGCATPNFYDQLRRTNDRKPVEGGGVFLQRQPSTRNQPSIWLAHCETDRWKSFEHARWLTAQGKPGCAYLFGELSDEDRKWFDKRLPSICKEHFKFAKHLTAEIETDEIYRGVMRRVWKVKAGRVQNHYFDASYLADVAAAIRGVRLLDGGKPIATGQRRTLSQMSRAG